MCVSVLCSKTKTWQLWLPEIDSIWCLYILQFMSVGYIYIHLPTHRKYLNLLCTKYIDVHYNNRYGQSRSHDGDQFIKICLKGIVHPKMKILSSFTHPQVVPNLYETYTTLAVIRKIFWRKFVTRLFWGTIDFHSRKKNTMEVNGAPELLCFPHSSEYLPLCSAE